MVSQYYGLRPEFLLHTYNTHLLVTAARHLPTWAWGQLDEEENVRIVLRLIAVTLGQLQSCCVVTLVTLSYLGGSDVRAPNGISMLPFPMTSRTDENLILTDVRNFCAWKGCLGGSGSRNTGPLTEKICTNADSWCDCFIPKWNCAPVALYMGWQLVPECPPPTFLSVA